MKTIYLSNIVIDTYTNSAGYSLYLELEKYISKGKKVILSFKNATPTSSSFLNSSIGEVIDKFGFDSFKSQIKLSDMSKSQAGVLKKYFDSCDLHV